MTRVRILWHRSQERNMEHSMDLHAWWQGQLVCVFADDLGDDEWAQILPIELSGRSLSAYVLSI